MWYCELVLIGAPIIIIKLLKVDYLANMLVFHSKEFTTPHLDLHTDLGCRRKTPTYAQILGCVYSEIKWDIQALGWCPGLVVMCLQFQLCILYKQPQCGVPI